jgi:hypothetical protein
MLNVITVLKSGGIYDATWVARLQAGVAKHLKEPHQFVCFSDVEVPCRRLSLLNNLPGWWSKIEALSFPGPVLMLDLDTAIVGDLGDIARHATETPFTMLRDFYAPDHFGSGVMAWNDNASAVYIDFMADPMVHIATQRARMGDQAFIEEACAARGRAITAWQDAVGDQIVSYKVHCRDGIPVDARMICLHGAPKFADMPANDPVRRAWEMAA